MDQVRRAPRRPGLKRWNDPRAPSDGRRLLICRFRPRALPKAAETWDDWLPNLGPSRELLAAYHGKSGPAISWAEFRRRYLRELRGRRPLIEEAARRAAGGPMT